MLFRSEIAAGRPVRFVHAYDGAAVVESPLGAWWFRRLAAAFAFPGVDAAPPAAGDAPTSLEE